MATLIDAGSAGEICVLQGDVSGRIKLLQDIAFGHKVCIAEIPVGANVIKYGQVIGKASRPIKVGEHAHVENVMSSRRSSDLATRMVT